MHKKYTILYIIVFHVMIIVMIDSLIYDGRDLFLKSAQKKELNFALT